MVLVDFNVPIKNGKVLDDFRIKKAIPTIKFLEKKDAKIILITHLGKDGTESLEPVIKHFFKISKCSKSRISFFENVRKHKGEMENSLSFAKKLAELGDVYVNEAFSVSHRNHASIVSLPKLLPSYAGFQLEEEVKNLSKVFKNPKHPFLYIAGGAKFETKLPLIEKYLRIADKIFVGGALANDFLKAKGYEVGKSLVSDSISGIGNIAKNLKIILPKDVVVKYDTNSAYAEDVSLGKAQKIGKKDMIIDIGKESVKNLENLIKKSKTILWNGPLGKYEDGGGKATKEIIKFILKSYSAKASQDTAILGGGDLASLVPKNYLKSKRERLKPGIFISTGGGATLDFLANGTLPGIRALK